MPKSLRRPNLEESIVSIWLSHMGYSNIKDLSASHQDPPDFEIDGNIGVEVTRLSPAINANASHQTLESLENPAIKAICKALIESDNPPNDYTMEVSCDLPTQELPPRNVTLSTVKKGVAQYLAKLNHAIQSNSPLPICRTEPEHGITLHFHSAQTSEECQFVLAQVDASGPLGWTISDLITIINRCIRSKTQAASSVANQYKQLWLVLVDHNTNMPPSSDASAWNEIRAGINVPQPWSKVIVLSSHTQYDYIDLP